MELSFDTSMKMKFKKVEKKIYNIEYRGMSRLEALPGNSAPPKFFRRVQIQRFTNRIFQSKFETYD